MTNPLDFLKALREGLIEKISPEYYEVPLNLPAVNESLAAFDEALKSVSYISLIPNAAHSFETNLALLESVSDDSTIILKEENGELVEIFTGLTITYKTQRNGVTEIHKGDSGFVFAIVKKSDRVDKTRVEEYKKNMDLNTMKGYLKILMDRAERRYNQINAELAEKIKKHK